MKQEIVVVAGPPGGGKSTFALSFVKDGYFRVNRDHLGGSLQTKGLVYQTVREAYATGHRSFVLDNTYVDKKSRAVVLALGQEFGLPVRLLWLMTTPEQAQFLAARRQIQRYGHLLTPAEYKFLGKNDPNMFPPAAQFVYWKRQEEPDLSEGFSSIERGFLQIDLGQEYVNSAIIFDYDGTLRTTKSGEIYPRHPDDVVLLPNRRAKLQELQQRGVRLLGASNQSGIAKDPSDPRHVSESNAIASFRHTNALLGVDIDFLFAPERSGVPQSYWRKPMPGMGVVFIEKYKLNPRKCLFVGDLGTDETFAMRAGFQFRCADEYFFV